MIEKLTDHRGLEYIEVAFREIKGNSVNFIINCKNKQILFVLEETSIEEIRDIIERFCRGFNVGIECVKYTTSHEILNEINKKTLYNKTIWEIFKENHIKIV